VTDARPTRLRAGRLLVATPALVDPSFLRAVVLLLEFDTDEGALGVVLSRPSKTPVGTLLPAWQQVAANPAVVHVGGPLCPTAAIGLVAVHAGNRPELPSGSFAPLPTDAATGGLVLGTVDLDADALLVAPALAGMRLFAGYASWGSGQLEAEVAEGAWYVLDALPLDPFVPSPERLWRDVLHRQGPPLALVGAMPVDPSVN
jgi:putative transcriptional regulator